MNNASDIYDAAQLVTERAEQWRKEHPDEKMDLCPICGGSGLIRYYEDIHGNAIGATQPGAYEFLKPCSCVQGESATKRNNKKFAAVPGLYQDATLENFSVTIYNDLESNQLAGAAKEIATQYIEHFDKMLEKGIGLYIWSQSRGSGKSRLASTISNELTERGHRNKYVSSNAILSEIQKSWDEKNISEEQVMRPYLESQLLIIDDLGARSKKDWIDERMFWLIDTRYQNNMPTIFTSNYDIEELPLDSRVRDRLGDVDRFVNIKMPRVSVRRQTRSDSVSEFYKVIKE